MQSGADDGLVAALWVAVPVDAALAAVALFFYYSGRGGTATVAAMRIPGIARLLRDASLVPFLWTLADLYESGVPIDQAVSGAARVSGVYYRAELEEVARAARAGRALVPELARTTLVDETTLAILQPAEVTGTLSDALVRAATLAEQRLASGLAVACRAPGAILYAVAVLIVATMVFKFYSNMYSVPDWFR
jgi:type II secretory pathway component PulF